MNLFPINQGRLDFSLPTIELRNLVLKTKNQYKSTEKRPAVCLEKFQENLTKSEFLMPIFVGWKKAVTASCLLESKEISMERKKDLRRALRNSAALGVKCKTVHPLSGEMKAKFLNYYHQSMEEKGYESLLKEEYFLKNDPTKLYLIYIEDAAGKFCGGQLVNRISKNKLSIHYKAVESNKIGYDFLLENQLYELAVTNDIKVLRYGKDFNLRGVDGRKSTLFYYKMRFGYQPFFAKSLPIAYVDLSTFSQKTFDYLLFISIDNTPGITDFDLCRYRFNIILGKKQSTDLTEVINYLKKFSTIAILDQDFNQPETAHQL
jgi:hypothetical protein